MLTLGLHRTMLGARETDPLAFLQNVALRVQTHTGDFALKGISGNIGDAVATWSDVLSTSGRSLAEATNRPITATEEGVPYVKFDGTNDKLQSLFTLPQPYTFTVLYRHRHPYATADTVADGGAGLGLIYDRAPAITGTLQSGLYVSSDVVYAGQPLSNGNWEAVSGVFNGASSKLYKNGTARQTGNVGAGAAGGITIGTRNGGGSAVKTDVIAVLVQTGETSAGDIAQMHAYLKTLAPYNAEFIHRTVATRRALIVRPANPNGVLIVYHHGAGDQDTTFPEQLSVDPYGTAEAYRAIINAGYTLCSIITTSSGGFGRELDMDEYEALYTDAASLYTFTDVVAMASSMGGLSALSCVAQNRYGVTCRGALLWQPICSLAAAYADNGAFFKASIDTAYNIPGGGDYATQTAGYDPALLSGEFMNKRLMFIASASDATVIKANNSDVMAAQVSDFATEVATYTATGLHSDPSHFTGPALTAALAFLARCR